MIGYKINTWYLEDNEAIGYKISPWYLEDNEGIGLILWDNTQAHRFFYQSGHWNIKHSIPTSSIKQISSFYKIIKWCDILNLQALPLYAKHTNRSREPLPQLFQPPFLHCNRKFFRSLFCNNRLFRRWAFFLSIQLLFPSVYNCPQIIFHLLNLNF